MYQKYIQTNDDEKTKKKHKENKLRKKRFDVNFFFWAVNFKKEKR